MRLSPCSCALFSALFILFLSAQYGMAGFLGRVSLSVGEEYNDNVLFSQTKEHDFVTSLTPTLSLLYAPTSQTVPTLTARLSIPGEIFASHSELNNFGDNIAFNAGYTHYYSPTLTFHLSDSLRRTGSARTAAPGDDMGFPSSTLPTAAPPPGGVQPPSIAQSVAGLVTNGAILTNTLSARGIYLYAPDITLNGSYSMGSTFRLSQGGSDLFQSVGFRGVYAWRQEHNFHAGYAASLINFSGGGNNAGAGGNGNNLVHSLDIGDDYFSKFDPTLTLSATSGISLNTSSQGPRIANNTSLTLIKVWEAASLNAGVRKGLTDSPGGTGLSNTTSFLTRFNIRLTEYLAANADVVYSMFDTATTKYQTFQARAGLQYWITPWLSSGLSISHQRRNGGSGAASTTLSTGARINGSSVFLFFSNHFDIWPVVGLARGPILPQGTPSAGPSGTPPP